MESNMHFSTWYSKTWITSIMESRMGVPFLFFFNVQYCNRDRFIIIEQTRIWSGAKLTVADVVATPVQYSSSTPSIGNHVALLTSSTLHSQAREIRFEDLCLFTVCPVFHMKLKGACLYSMLDHRSQVAQSSLNSHLLWAPAVSSLQSSRRCSQGDTRTVQFK